MLVTDVRKAVIPAAGLGTRFLPATKSTPKEMLPLIDRPVIQYVVEEAIDSGIDEREHLFGHRLGRREETSPEACRRNDGLPDLHHQQTPS